MSLTGGNNSMGGDEGGRETEDTGPPVSTLLRECGGHFQTSKQNSPLLEGLLN